MELAFKIATEDIGIPSLLDVEDVCDVAKPDERSMMTYIAYWFHAFSHLDRIETAGRRVEKFVEVMQGAWDMQHGYEKRMAAVQTPNVGLLLWKKLTVLFIIAPQGNQTDKGPMGHSDFYRYLRRC